MKKFSKAYALFAVFGLALAMAGCSNSSSAAAPIVFPPTDTTGSESAGGGAGGGGNSGSNENPGSENENPGNGGENTGGKTAATISFAEADVGKGAEEAAFTNALTNTGDGAVTYSSSNPGAATVDAATGQVTIVAKGTTTITATVADSATYSYAQKTVSYTLTVYPQYMAIPLTIEPAFGVTLKIDVKNAPPSFKYSRSDENLMRDFSGQQDKYNGTIHVPYPTKVCFYADMTYNTSPADNAFRLYTSNWDCYVYGNVNSLLDSKKFVSLKTTKIDHAFAFLFKDNINMKNHSDASKPLVLPATTLTKMCYYFMFEGCKSLTKAPDLPAQTLAESCYDRMFHKCDGLTTTPALPATKLASYCYYGMFMDCKGFTDAVPLELLPARELAKSCYENMFSGCSNLKYAPELPSKNLQEACYCQMFSSCTELKTAPGLTAKTLVKNCYARMFQSCEKLNSVCCYATDISADGCLTRWLAGVAADGNFTQYDHSVVWPRSENGIPLGWVMHYYNNN